MTPRYPEYDLQTSNMTSIRRIWPPDVHIQPSDVHIQPSDVHIQPPDVHIASWDVNIASWDVNIACLDHNIACLDHNIACLGQYMARLGQYMARLGQYMARLVNIRPDGGHMVLYTARWRPYGPIYGQVGPIYGQVGPIYGQVGPIWPGGPYMAMYGTWPCRWPCATLPRWPWLWTRWPDWRTRSLTGTAVYLRQGP